MKEEELNELKTQNLIHSEKDIKVFERLYSTLSRTDKSFELSGDFQMKIERMLIQRRREEKFEKLILISGGIIFLIAALITLAVVGVFDKSNIFGNMQWYMVIFILMVYAFNRLEKKYLRST